MKRKVSKNVIFRVEYFLLPILATLYRYYFSQYVKYTIFSEFNYIDTVGRVVHVHTVFNRCFQRYFK